MSAKTKGPECSLVNGYNQLPTDGVVLEGHGTKCNHRKCRSSVKPPPI